MCTVFLMDKLANNFVRINWPNCFVISGALGHLVTNLTLAPRAVVFRYEESVVLGP